MILISPAVNNLHSEIQISDELASDVLSNGVYTADMNQDGFQFPLVTYRVLADNINMFIVKHNVSKFVKP